ncbi:MAG: hypothetical protein ACI9MC_002867 [Kiritimatiellia bacterium]|jgi:hypothetical protein
MTRVRATPLCFRGRYTMLRGAWATMTVEYLGSLPRSTEVRFMLMILLAQLVFATPLLQMPLQFGDGALAEVVDDRIVVVHLPKREAAQVMVLDHALQGVQHELIIPLTSELLAAQRTGDALALLFADGSRSLYLIRVGAVGEPQTQRFDVERRPGEVMAVRLCDSGAYIHGRIRGKDRLLYVGRDDEAAVVVQLPLRLELRGLRASEIGAEASVRLRGRGERVHLASVDRGRVSAQLLVESAPGEPKVLSAWRARGLDGETLVVGRSGRARTRGWFVARYDGDRRIARVDVSLPDHEKARVLAHDLVVHDGELLLSGEVVRRTVAAGALRESPRSIAELVMAWRTRSVVAMSVAASGDVRWRRMLPLERQVYPSLQRRTQISVSEGALRVQLAFDGALTTWTHDGLNITAARPMSGPHLPGDVGLSTRGELLSDGRALLWGTRSQPGEHTIFFVEVVR